jgi:hypothetical protein
VKKYIPESAESVSKKLTRAEQIINEEGLKLFEETQIKYKFDNYSGELKLFFVKQTDFSGGRLKRAQLEPLIEKLREINKRWWVGIMLYGASKYDE